MMVDGFRNAFRDSPPRSARCRKTPITAADLVNDRVVPFYDAREVRLCRVLTDRGTEYCGNPEHHEYELYLALEDIDHSRTKTKSPQTTDVIDKCFLARSELFSSRAWVTAWRRAGREVQALPRSLHRRASVAAPCAPAWDHAGSNRRRSARRPSRLARPTALLIAMALDIVRMGRASLAAFGLVPAFSSRSRSFSRATPAGPTCSFRLCSANAK